MSFWNGFEKKAWQYQLVGAGVGAGLGALAGHSTEQNKGRNAAIGALAGAGLGAGAVHLIKGYVARHNEIVSDVDAISKRVGNIPVDKRSVHERAMTTDDAFKKHIEHYNSLFNL